MFAVNAAADNVTNKFLGNKWLNHTLYVFSPNIQKWKAYFHASIQKHQVSTEAAK